MKAPKDKKVPRTGKVTIPGVDVQQLEGLLDFMATHSLEELEYQHGGLHVRLKKAAAGYDPAHRIHVSPVRSAPASAASPSSGPGDAVQGAAVSEELHFIKSPIVGTFYAAPSPDAPSFVKVGDTIHASQVVCIIEAMKLMNEIEADVSGKVVRVLVENGQPVEYGQPLFAIRPAKK